jgi:hypothetical protein
MGREIYRERSSVGVGRQYATRSLQDLEMKFGYNHFYIVEKTKGFHDLEVKICNQYSIIVGDLSVGDILRCKSEGFNGCTGAQWISFDIVKIKNLCDIPNDYYYDPEEGVKKIATCVAYRLNVDCRLLWPAKYQALQSIKDVLTTKPTHKRIMDFLVKYSERLESE